MIPEKLHKIYFTKLFLSGNLKGLWVRTAVETYTPNRYRVGEKGKDCLTRDRWIITDASFQNYNR